MHGRAVVLVAVHPEQALVAHPRVGDQLREQLGPGKLGPVVVLELQEQALLLGDRRAEQALVLGRVEPSVRLQVRVLVHLRGRGEDGCVLDLLICDADPPLLVFLLEKEVRDQLVECLVLDLPTLVQVERAAGPLFLLLRERLREVLPRDVGDLVPIHLRDDRRAGDGRPAE